MTWQNGAAGVFLKAADKIAIHLATSIC